MTPALTRIIGYTRTSTDEQENGIQAQEAIIRRVAAQRDWVVVDIVHDQGVSGAAEKRPARDYAIARIESGEADALVASKLDRLSRSTVDFGDLLERASKQKWALVVLDPEVDMTTAAGELVAGILMQVAQFERRLISQRTKEGLDAVRARGGVTGRGAVADELRGRILGLAEAGMSNNGIANLLNEEGVPTAQGGAKWYASTIRNIVRGDT